MSLAAANAAVLCVPAKKFLSIAQSVDCLKLSIGLQFFSDAFFDGKLKRSSVADETLENPKVVLSGTTVTSLPTASVIFDGDMLLLLAFKNAQKAVFSFERYEMFLQMKTQLDTLMKLLMSDHCSVSPVQLNELLCSLILQAQTHSCSSIDAIVFATAYAAIKMPAFSAVLQPESAQWLSQQAIRFAEAVALLPESCFCDPTAFQRIEANCPAPFTLGVPKVPVNGERNVLITSALPYVNNVPHLGNIIGCVLSADVYARFCRLRDYRTVYVCGTDEYGTATETKALEEGVTCAQLCDKYYALQSQVYAWFDISFDYFGRTTTTKQTEIAQDIFLKLHKRGLLLKEPVEQLLCCTCNRYLADRYVEGTCPLCRFPDARGDQCDGCGKLLNATELLDPKCKVCRASPVLRASEHLFLDLERLQPKCEAFVRQSAAIGKWSPNGVSITNAWFQEGLKPRCITRDLKWGTPVPLEDMKDKVFYVWFDAPIGYISITANFVEDWEAWWKNPDNVQLYQFMGKDNVPFHSVIFPSSLIGTEDAYTLVHNISTTEYLNYESGKFSKSRNIGVFGNNVVDSKIPVAVWRYYLLANRPEAADTTFLWDDFAAKTNAELLANLGNFINRTLKYVVAKFGGELPPFASDAALIAEDAAFVERIDAELAAYIAHLEDVKIKAALKSAMAISALGNEYLTVNKLDAALHAQNPQRCAAVVHFTVNVIYLLSTLLYPFIPSAAEDILRQLNAPLGKIPANFSFCIKAGHVIGTPTHLFRKIDVAQIAHLKQLYGGSSSSILK